MPSKFGRMTTIIVIVIVVVAFALGWLIRYPDVSTGAISINANTASISLVSNGYGKLKLLKENQFFLPEETIIAYLENSAELDDMMLVDSLLRSFDSYSNRLLEFRTLLPTRVSLGELNIKYYAFTNALQEYINYYTEDYYSKQQETVSALLGEQRLLLESAQRKALTTMESLEISKRNYRGDSVLYKRNVVSEAEFDRSRQSYLSAENLYQNTANEINSARQQIYGTTQQLQEIAINKRESEKKLLLELTSAFNELSDNIKSWKSRYLFVTPIAGQLQYLKFWTDNRFIAQGEEVFAIIPKEDELYGEVMLPAAGAGKVAVGQEVIIKLDNYPYYEFGSIAGHVRDISLVSNVSVNSMDKAENYLLTITLPDGLVTNYGYKLDFKYEIKGTADIVTRNRNLIQRMFDSIRYLANN
jgi:multidrug resistance efflux pump